METISDILLWCFVMGFGVMFIWLAMILMAGDYMYKLHTKMFNLEISRGSYMMLHICGIGLWKLAVMLCFLLPWLAIQIVSK